MTLGLERPHSNSVQFRSYTDTRMGVGSETANTESLTSSENQKGRGGTRYGDGTGIDRLSFLGEGFIKIHLFVCYVLLQIFIFYFSIFFRIYK